MGGHPGVQAVLKKIRQGISVTENELLLLKRQIVELEHPYHARELPETEYQPIEIEREAKPLVGRATLRGLRKAAQLFGKHSIDFYRSAQGLLFSTIGIGTYHGDTNAQTDSAYGESIKQALCAGVTVIDTSLNYRFERSEHAIAYSIRSFIEHCGGARAGIIVCTKGGYLVPGAAPTHILGAEDTVDGRHSLAASFLTDQIDRSRRNLGLETIDIYYLHNPEFQLHFVSRKTLTRRLYLAFEAMERAVADRRIGNFGVATWDGFRKGLLSLSELCKVAKEVAGEGHHFRFAQMPFNFAMREMSSECLSNGKSVLDCATDQSITVTASSTLMHGRLTSDLPPAIANAMPGLRTDTQRAIQFVRSTPGICVALIGMRNPIHVSENVLLAKCAPLTSPDYLNVLSALR
jgi:aryl-alcohol dehydrogenase-like predicted oxidoreductase